MNNTIISYAQYDEDIILSSLLFDVNKGFYVDVGANHSTHDSVTKYFYDKGWRGVNIEPLKSLSLKLNKDRPKDINVACGVGDKDGSARLREYVDLSGHSTFDESQQQLHDSSIK